jgi:putative endonuclease
LRGCEALSRGNPSNDIQNTMEHFMRERQPAVYIMANKFHGTIYTGVTNDLIQRIYQHKQNLTKGFTQRYRCHFLVYYELHYDIVYAIEREKQIKAGSRKNKLKLIEAINPSWFDLYPTLF